MNSTLSILQLFILHNYKQIRHLISVHVYKRKTVLKVSWVFLLLTKLMHMLARWQSLWHKVLETLPGLSTGAAKINTVQVPCRHLNFIYLPKPQSFLSLIHILNAIMSAVKGSGEVGNLLEIPATKNAAFKSIVAFYSVLLTHPPWIPGVDFAAKKWAKERAVKSVVLQNHPKRQEKGSHTVREVCGVADIKAHRVLDRKQQTKKTRGPQGRRPSQWVMRPTMATWLLSSGIIQVTGRGTAIGEDRRRKSKDRGLTASGSNHLAKQWLQRNTRYSVNGV